MNTVHKSNESKNMGIRKKVSTQKKTKNHHEPSRSKVLDSGNPRNSDESTPVIHNGGLLRFLGPSRKAG
ncbi:hypothetical protein P3392_23680, partial [Vibrio parahaemolyticus]|nr:hypothetical protein [Vibrio parahaemolyticus]